MDCSGSDTTGAVFRNTKEMWEHELPGGQSGDWYGKAVDYWAHQPATVNGVLGGFGQVSPVDVRDSTVFLREAASALLAEKAAGKRTLTVLDCGAGVGRVSQELLLPFFDTVDLCEPVPKLLDQARANLT